MEESFVEYLRKTPDLDRFLRLWKEKYIKLDRLGGSILLQNISSAEADALGLLLGQMYYKETDVKVSYTQFEKRISQTKYKDIDFVKVLELYFDEKIITNAKQRMLDTQMLETAYQELHSSYRDSKAMQWISNCKIENIQLYNRVLRTYLQDKQSIKYSFDAINALPLWKQEICSISIFSNQITKDPHFFDTGFPLSIVMDAIYYYLGYDKKTYTLQEKNTILLEAGLVKEETMNYCMVFHLYAKNKEGTSHDGLAYFSNHYESMNIHVGNILNISSFYQSRKIIVIENPSVFQSLSEVIKENKLTDIGLVCTNGELNYAGYVLLDTIYKSNIEMYYCGDFDPEGLLIADKLKRRYKEAIILWCYGITDYNKAISSNSLTDIRLEKLKHCTSMELQPIKEQLATVRKAGYQESLINVYKKRILLL